MEGTYFAAWVPSAEQVCVIGDFNGWDKTSHALRPKEQSVVWDLEYEWGDQKWMQERRQRNTLDAPISSHGHPYALNLTLPSLAIVFFKNKEDLL